MSILRWILVFSSFFFNTGTFTRWKLQEVILIWRYWINCFCCSCHHSYCIFQPCQSSLLGATKCNSSRVTFTEIISWLWHESRLIMSTTYFHWYLTSLWQKESRVVTHLIIKCSSLPQISMASCTTSPTPTGIKLKWWLASPWSSTRSCRSMELTRWGAETNTGWGVEKGPPAVLSPRFWV